jgi:hypothetical protein
MARRSATITLALLGKRVALMLLGMTVLNMALCAQQEEGPEVVYAAAPEWPALDMQRQNNLTKR